MRLIFADSKYAHPGEDLCVNLLVLYIENPNGGINAGTRLDPIDPKILAELQQWTMTKVEWRNGSASLHPVLASGPASR